MKRPSFQFYPGDYLRDTALRSCSVAARGLWMDMLCLMHEGNPYGYLKVGHKVILPVNLCLMVGATLPEVEGWLKELEDAQVFSRDDDGCIFSRRMVRDEHIRQVRAAAGVKGGNPSLLAGRTPDARLSERLSKKDNQKPTPSSSSSSSSAINTPQPPKWEPDEPLPFTSDRFAEAWAEWEAHRKAKRSKLTPQARSRQIKKLRELGEEESIRWIEYAIEQGWTGLYEPKSNGQTAMAKRRAGEYPEETLL